MLNQKKINNFRKNKSGSEALEFLGSFWCLIFIGLGLVMVFAYVYRVGELNYVGRRAVRLAETTGQYDAAQTASMVQSLYHGDGPVTIECYKTDKTTGASKGSLSDKSKIQLRDTFAIKLTGSYTPSLFNLGKKKYPVTATIQGMSEVYNQELAAPEDSSSSVSNSSSSSGTSSSSSGGGTTLESGTVSDSGSFIFQGNTGTVPSYTPASTSDNVHTNTNGTPSSDSQFPGSQDIHTAVMPKPSKSPYPDAHAAVMPNPSDFPYSYGNWHWQDQYNKAQARGDTAGMAAAHAAAVVAGTSNTPSTIPTASNTSVIDWTSKMIPPYAGIAAAMQAAHAAAAANNNNHT